MLITVSVETVIHYHSRVRYVRWKKTKKKEINNFIRTDIIKLIKSDSKGIHNVTKDLYFK